MFAWTWFIINLSRLNEWFRIPCLWLKIQVSLTVHSLMLSSKRNQVLHTLRTPLRDSAKELTALRESNRVVAEKVPPVWKLSIRWLKYYPLGTFYTRLPNFRPPEWVCMPASLVRWRSWKTRSSYLLIRGKCWPLIKVTGITVISFARPFPK